jgi:hypothetical protein
MKKQCIIVLATVAAMIIGLGSLTSVRGSDVVLSIPGFTIVQDAKDDLLLRRCDPVHPGISCSLPPSAAPLPDLPGYFDIKNAKIIQHGPKYVDLFIALYAPIPPEPPYGHVNYFWQFEGGCVEGSSVDKSGISITWNGSAWTANWYVIITCQPTRTTAPGPSVPFEFTNDGVKVRVTLDDLKSAIDPGGTLVWHAGVRRVPFIYNPDGYPNFPHTVAVDYAPDVVVLLPPPDYIGYPELPTTWEPR